MKYISIAIFSLLFSQVIAQKSEKDVSIRYITKSMQEQQDCWNKGDLTCFMSHYWKSDSVRFMGSSGLTYGYQNTLDNYIKGYPNKEAMGQLKFDNSVIEFADDHTILVIGKWHLKRGGNYEDVGGMYSLLWQQKNGAWVIVLDHSS